MDILAIILAAAAFGAFGYFLYKRLKDDKPAKKGGGRTRTPGQPRKRQN